VDPLSSWSSRRHAHTTSEWGVPQLRSSYSLRDHVNNQRSRVTPRSTATGTPCQVEDDPRKSEIEDSLVIQKVDSLQHGYANTCPTGPFPQAFDLDSRNPLQGEVSPHEPWTWTCGVHVKRGQSSQTPDWTREIRVRRGQPPQTEDPCEDEHRPPSRLSLNSCNNKISCTDCAPSRTSLRDRTSPGSRLPLTLCNIKVPVLTAPVPVSLVPQYIL